MCVYVGILWNFERQRKSIQEEDDDEEEETTHYIQRLFLKVRNIRYQMD